MKTKISAGILSLFVLTFLFLSAPVQINAQGAGCSCICTNTQIGSVADEAACRQECAEGDDTFESCVPEAQPQNQNNQQNAGGVQQLPNPLGAGTTIPELIARVIKAAMGLVGAVGLLMFLYGGFTWMTAGGNDEKVKQGKQVLTWAVLGMIVIFTSYAVLSFVIERLTTSTSGNNIEQNQPQP